MKDLLSAEAAEALARWSSQDQSAFATLLQQVASELQKEFLHRAVAAKNPARDVLAFAKALRALDDEAVFAACTLQEGTGASQSVISRLRAEADPLYGFLQNGHSLDGPAKEGSRQKSGAVQEARRPRPALSAAPPRPSPQAQRTTRRAPADPLLSPMPLGAAHREEQSDVQRRVEKRELGGGDEPSFTASRSAGVEGRIAEDLINEAVRPLGLVYKEQAVDTPRLRLEQALEAAVDALARGIPVPLILGKEPGDFRRYVLMLQVQAAGAGRAFQLHDPFSQETVWAHEKDLCARAELPFSRKSFRRITAIALPQRPSKARP